VVEGGFQRVVEVHSIGELPKHALEQPRMATCVFRQSAGIDRFASKAGELAARVIVEWTQVESLGEVEWRRAKVLRVAVSAECRAAREDEGNS